MTYRELLKFLSNVPNHSLDDDITLYNVAEDEFYSGLSAEITTEDSAIDENQIYISFNKP